MLLELGEKYNKLERKVETMSKFVIKKKKINVLIWLNDNIKPEFLFEGLIEKIEILDEDIDYLCNNSFLETLNNIFSRNIYNISHENSYPIYAFVQKSHLFYIYDKINDNKTEWHELCREKLIKFLNKILMKMLKYFNDWKKKKSEEIKTNDSFATICDKTTVKLVSMDFKNEHTLGKFKSALYNKIKKNMKAFIEYEFEF
jgi:hypothetical protein